jgi:Kef-type K+ transport system membrane component KefB
MADPIAVALITLGGLFLAGLAADALGRRTRLPRVTLLLLLGVGAGPLGFDLIPASGADWFPFVADLTLLMVAFLLGVELRLPLLRRHGRAVLCISLTLVVVTASIMALGLVALGWPASVGLLLAAVATSTDPVAVSDVVREARADGPFSKTLLGIVAVDDAWGLVALSISLAAILAMENPDAAQSVVLHGVTHMLGAVLLGGLLGVPMAFLTGRVRAGEPSQAEALGGVLLCGGLSLLLEVSFLLSTMTMGIVVANVAHHHRRPFRAIAGIEWPFMVLFFLLSGASIAAEDLAGAATLTIAYIVLRVMGRIAGGWLGSWWSGRPLWSTAIGFALLPQAGIAIGMALMASQRLPGLDGTLLSAVVAATIVFELIGPVLTRYALEHLGEVRAS